MRPRDGGVQGIAYTWAIRRDGQLVLCNDLDCRLWSQGFADRPGDENAQFMSVLFEGTFADPASTTPRPGSRGTASCRQVWGW